MQRAMRLEKLLEKTYEQLEQLEAATTPEEEVLEAQVEQVLETEAEDAQLEAEAEGTKEAVEKDTRA